MSKMQTRPTNMALAFVNAAVKAVHKRGSIRNTNWMVRKVVDNADREVGTTKEPGWNAHLSKRTADALISQGIL